MAAQRLNNRIRNRILEHMIGEKFEPEIKVLNELEERIANLAYSLYLPSARRKAVASLPASMFGTRSTMPVAVMGETSNFAFSKNPDKPESRLVGADLRSSHTLPSSLSINLALAEGRSRTLGDLVTKHRRDTEDMKNRRSRLSNDISAVLASVPTRKKLIEEWPELEPTLDRIYPETSASPYPTKALAVQLGKLNEALHLPEVSKAKEEAVTT